VGELVAAKRMERRMGDLVAQPYHSGRSGSLIRAAEVLTATGASAAVLAGRRNSPLTRLAGAALVTASALTRFGIFEAGRASADTPEHTIGPQRDRRRARG
jgi:hypothetical protein